MNADGSAFNTRHHFGDGSDGIAPMGVTLAGSRLYGTTMAGGATGAGTLFSLNTDGSHYGIVHDFSSEQDGSAPNGSVLVSESMIYGVTGAARLANATISAAERWLKYAAGDPGVLSGMRLLECRRGAPVQVSCLPPV